MDNISIQAEEMETLKSIFEDQWQIDSKTGICSIDITKEVTLFITLTPDYPSDGLPKYELLAPELKLSQKKAIEAKFQSLYENEGGGPLIYQMIMSVDSIVKQNKEHKEGKPPHQESPAKENINEPVCTNELKIFHGPIITDRKSVFQGHVCTVKNKDDVRCFMELLLQNRKIAQATHNISAYRIVLPNNIILQDCDDDGENRASSRLLELIQTMKLCDVMVVVSRWYGGIQLGPDRFRHITNAARQAFLEAGLAKS
ncbi:protein IMPACT-B [Leptinotarsa decemlineata]|uniref:protein IMPACT-B n=1 Tax=Leptinotarsa decemlineata TaxID=7539 RepID=UPI003D30B3CD